MPITQLPRTQTTSVSGAVTVRPEAQSAGFASTASLATNTAQTVFSAASNTGGAVLLSADICNYDGVNAGYPVFITKSSAPTSITDGSVVLGGKPQFVSGNAGVSATLPKEQYIAAGQGLYFISNNALTVNNGQYRACRYVLL